jgi:protein SCO1/2
MNQPARKMDRLVWGGLALTIAVIGAAFTLSRLRGGEHPLPVIGRLPDFSLTNQTGERVTLADLRGKIWVADIIFARCPGPCATMTKRMAELQSDLRANEPVRLVTLTSDPSHDTPEVLKKYAERFGADAGRWSFLTGNLAEIRGLAVNDFKFTVVERDPQDRAVPDDLFIHSTWFALIDQQGRVRGWTDTQGRMHAYFESSEPEALAQLRSAIRQLLREPAPTT